MHAKLGELYDCNCEDCNHGNEHLNLAINPRLKKLLKTVETAFKKLQKKGSYNPKDLATEKEYTAIITETANVLERSFADNDLSDDMRKSLEEDVFYFSALKTHAQLFDASRELLTDDGTIKSFTQFSNDVSSIKVNYNENYLEAEYDFAVGSTLMAERWDRFRESDRYLLQYRTANDDKVRDTHVPLHEITLPKSDIFWDRFFPPNGWRCRCTTVQVLASKNEPSDLKKAIKAGEEATTQLSKSGKNKLEIFRFNAGRQKVVFPPTHPYGKVKGAKQARSQAKQILKDQD